MIDKYYYVLQYGAVWRIPKRKFLKMLRDGIAGRDYDLDKIGKRVTTKLYAPIDWDCGDYSDVLDEVRGGKDTMGAGTVVNRLSCDDGA